MAARLLLLYLILLLMSCGQKKNNPATLRETARREMLGADSAFSAMSRVKGMKHAYIEFIDSNGVLLRPDRFPVTGANAIEFLLQQNDSDYNITWQPDFADVAASGDMGYIYGVYEVRLKTTDSSFFGSYVSIWKKQTDGKWKFTLECGNDGVGNE